MTDMDQAAQDSAFEAAFKEVSAAIDAGKMPEPDAPKGPEPDPAPQIVGEAPAEVPETVEEAPKGPEPDPETPVVDEEAPKEPEALQEPPKAAPTPSDEALKRLADALEAQNARQQPQQPQEQVPQQPQMPQLFTEDEAKLLVNFKEEYPEIAQALQVAQRAQGKLFEHRVEQRVQQLLGPLIETVDVLTARTQHMDLTQAIPEYDDYREKVIEWATSDKQPAYLRDAYKNVIQYGSREDIKDLYQRFYQETGVRPVAASQQAPVTPPKVAVRTASELPASAKQAARALAPVGSKRSEIPVASDPNDFLGAFDKWKDADLP